jgi:hypothetical protein
MVGRLWVWGSPALALVLATGVVALVAIAYAASSRRDIDATTEVAALVVLAAGVAAGLGQMQVASGLAAATALLLFEKHRLHGWVSRVHDIELQAALRFGVMAAVILPLLPTGGIDSQDLIRPRAVWLLVLAFSAISFVGYIAQRVIGLSRGYAVTGLLGGAGVLDGCHARVQPAEPARRDGRAGVRHRGGQYGGVCARRGRGGSAESDAGPAAGALAERRRPRGRAGGAGVLVAPSPGLDG